MLAKKVQSCCLHEGVAAVLSLLDLAGLFGTTFHGDNGRIGTGALGMNNTAIRWNRPPHHCALPTALAAGAAFRRLCKRVLLKFVYIFRNPIHAGFVIKFGRLLMANSWCAVPAHATPACSALRHRRQLSPWPVLP